MKASEMPFGFFMLRPDKSSERDYYYFKEHIEMMNKLLVGRRDEIQAQELSDAPFAQMDRSDQLKTLENFDRIVKHNNFLAAVSMLEKQIKNVIDYFERDKPEVGKFKLKFGPTLQQCFNHINNTMIDISEHLETLNELKKYYQYRNAIIHNIGYLDLETLKDKEILEFLRGFSSVEIQEEQGIKTNLRTTIRDNSFTIHFCAKAEKFIVAVFDKINIDTRFRNLNSEKDNL